MPTGRTDEQSRAGCGRALIGGEAILPDGLPTPIPASDGLDGPYWEGTRRHVLQVQYCDRCRRHQWGPEWICRRCQARELRWHEVEPVGRIFSWERVWHPSHPALREACPYVVVLIELAETDGVRMVGNLCGDPHQPVHIGSSVRGVFEDHDTAPVPYTLVQWRLVEHQGG